jgi:hypothetical protein
MKKNTTDKPHKNCVQNIFLDNLSFEISLYDRENNIAKKLKIMVKIFGFMFKKLLHTLNYKCYWSLIIPIGASGAL